MIQTVKQFVCGMVQTNCYIVVDEENGCVVVDCEESGGRIEEYLDKNNLKPAYVLLTHAHSDHIGGALAVKERYGAKIGIGRKDEELLLDKQKNLSAMMGNPVSVKPDVTFTDGQVLEIGGMRFTVMETPGHTQGSVCYIADGVIFSGDTLFAGSCGRTDFYSGNVQEMRKSLKKLSALSGNYKVYPGHMTSTELAFERDNNPFMAE